MVKEEDKIEMDGVVVEALPGTQFTVKLPTPARLAADPGKELLTGPGGQLPGT